MASEVYGLGGVGIVVARKGTGKGKGKGKGGRSLSARRVLRRVIPTIRRNAKADDDAASPSLLR